MATNPYGLNPATASLMNPLNNPYWGTSADGGLGGANGRGVFNWEQLAPLGYDVSMFAEQPMEGDVSPGALNPQATADWLAQNGLQLYEQPGPNGEIFRYVANSSGQIVGSPTDFNTNDTRFWNAAMLAAAVTGANIYSAGGLGGLGGAAGGSGSAAGSGNALTAGVGGGGGGGLGSLGGLTGAGPLTGGAVPVTGGSGLTFAGAGSGAGGVAGVGGYGGVSGAIGAAGAAGAAGGGAGMSSWIPGISNGQTLNLGLNILDGVLGANAARRSANAITDAGNQSNALQREMFDYQRGLNQPLVDMRNSVLPQIQALLANPNSITSQPGYEFGMREGTNALNTGAAARGMTYSGAQGKALQRYGQDYAGTKLDQSLNRLTTVAGLGQVGATNNQTASGNYGAGVGNTLQQMGNVRGSSYMGQANALTGSIGNIANNFQQQNLLRQLGYPSGD